MNKDVNVCVIIPAFNEQKVIRDVVENTIKVFKTAFTPFTVLVIDDNSTDNTVIEAEKGGAKVIHHLINSGAGGATSTGIHYALKHNFDIAVTLDADNQHDPADAVRGVQELIKHNYDLLIGTRLIDNNGMSQTKVIGNQGLSFLTYLLYGVKSTDSQSGLRVFSKRSIKELRWKSTRYEFCSEMLWRAKQRKLRIGEYPIRAIYTDYSISKGQSNWNGINLVKNMIKNRLMESLNE